MGGVEDAYPGACVVDTAAAVEVERRLRAAAFVRREPPPIVRAGVAIGGSRREFSRFEHVGDRVLVLVREHDARDLSATT